MSLFPQISVLVWLALTLCAQLAVAIRPPRGTLRVGPKDQRRFALMFLGATVGEFSLLWSGGFFKGMF